MIPKPGRDTSRKTSLDIPGSAPGSPDCGKSRPLRARTVFPLGCCKTGILGSCIRSTVLTSFANAQSVSDPPTRWLSRVNLAVVAFLENAIVDAWRVL